jgi:glutathione S-transferase
LTLQELGVEFEAITVNMLSGEHRSPAFVKLNSAGTLPVLVDGDVVLTEAVANRPLLLRNTAKKD